MPPRDQKGSTGSVLLRPPDWQKPFGRYRFATRLVRKPAGNKPRAFRVRLPWLGGLEPAALQARKVCLFSIPGCGDRERPERPEPSLLQGVLDIARLAKSTGCVKSRYRPGYSSHLRTGGRPQARATLGKGGYMADPCHTQPQNPELVDFFRCRPDEGAECRNCATLHQFRVSLESRWTP